MLSYVMLYYIILRLLGPKTLLQERLLGYSDAKGKAPDGIAGLLRQKSSPRVDDINPALPTIRNMP